jgi:exopolysaccharide biosynthesis polyprenyl glycosylphosphotransferase
MSQLQYSEEAPPLRVAPERVSPFISRLRGPGTAARRAWRGTYLRRLVIADAAAAVVASAAAVLVHTGQVIPWPLAAPPAVAVAFPAVWVVALLVSRGYDKRSLWEGPEEFRRVFLCTVSLVACIGTISWAFDGDISRDFVLVAVPLAATVTVVFRLLQRSWLRRERARGRLLQTTLLVGHPNGIAALHEQLVREPGAGYEVVGCCLPSAVSSGGFFDGLPVLGGPDDVASVVRRFEVDTVAVLPSRELDGVALRRLGWELEKTSAELLLAPAVTEIAGPRVRIRPVCGLSLLQMGRPELGGVRRLVKRAFDFAGACLGLIALAPVLLGVAVAVKSTSPGPVFFRQERVGRDGRSFKMLKFRTMEDGAERLLHQLAQHDEGNGVLFKMRRDPRVTRVGRVLRRYSVDELPQLVNVLKGEMSLVGPRPPLQDEVARYDHVMHRRFLVKPGMTGLWQVSGRSRLSWNDSVRVDVQYVEHWSLFLDLMILARTFRAVVRGDGAF